MNDMINDNQNEYEAVKSFLKSVSESTLDVEEYLSSIESISFDKQKEEFLLKKDKDDHELKKRVAWFLIGFLSIQTLLIFVLMVFQGFSLKGFRLDNYLFYILITGTIIENYFLVRIIVEHLFPKTDIK